MFTLSLFACATQLSARPAAEQRTRVPRFPPPASRAAAEGRRRRTARRPALVRGIYGITMT